MLSSVPEGYGVLLLFLPQILHCSTAAGLVSTLNFDILF